MIKIKPIDYNILDNIKGGSSIPIWAGIAIAAIVTFVTGVIKGITNPERCGE